MLPNSNTQCSRGKRPTALSHTNMLSTVLVHALGMMFLHLECLSFPLWPTSTYSHFKTQLKYHTFPKVVLIPSFFRKIKSIFLCALLMLIHSHINHVNLSIYSIPPLSSQLAIMNELLKNRNHVIYPYIIMAG